MQKINCLLRQGDQIMDENDNKMLNYCVDCHNTFRTSDKFHHSGFIWWTVLWFGYTRVCWIVVPSWVPRVLTWKASLLVVTTVHHLTHHQILSKLLDLGCVWQPLKADKEFWAKMEKINFICSSSIIFTGNNIT